MAKFGVKSSVEHMVDGKTGFNYLEKRARREKFDVSHLKESFLEDKEVSVEALYMTDASVFRELDEIFDSYTVNDAILANSMFSDDPIGNFEDYSFSVIKIPNRFPENARIQDLAISFGDYAEAKEPAEFAMELDPSDFRDKMMRRSLEAEDINDLFVTEDISGLQL